MQNYAERKTNQADANRQQGWGVQRALGVDSLDLHATVSQIVERDASDVSRITREGVRGVAGSNLGGLAVGQTAEVVRVNLAPATRWGWGNPSGNASVAGDNVHVPAGVDGVDLVQADQLGDERVYNLDVVLSELELWANESHPAQRAEQQGARNSGQNRAGFAVESSVDRVGDVEAEGYTAVYKTALGSEDFNVGHRSILAVPSDLQLKGK